LIHSLDTWPEYSVNDRIQGDAVWFEAAAKLESRTARSWIEEREWEEGRED
jgi:hypothetical protein